MAKKSKAKKNIAPTNVEFGMEFGDMNASKQFEVPLMNKENAKKKKK